MIGSYSPRTGRLMREDESVVNEANILAPQPNGGEALTVAGAGVVTSRIAAGPAPIRPPRRRYFRM